METFKPLPGFYLKGATVISTGVNFGIFSRNATKVTLEIFEHVEDTVPLFSHTLDPILNKIGDTWHIFIQGLTVGYYYGWRVDGPNAPAEGHRFDYSKLLLDPYAKCIIPKDFTPSSYRKCLIVDPMKFINWEGDCKPETPLKDTIIYEMHIKLFTMNENSGVCHRGTYKGLTEKINYLKELGVTAVELLPVFAFDADELGTINPYTGEKLKNVWGYNPAGFFSPSSLYMSQDRKVGALVGSHLVEFRELVQEMHKAGLEVILDVVYNHTEEGNEMGPVISFKGLDNSIYYMLSPDNMVFYCNYSGTGNTLNASKAVVKEMILDSLRYWYGYMNVDGFRFDLAAILGRDSKGDWIGDLSLLKDISDDSILSGAKLIAEGWDAAGGYFLGEFPCGWAEWNGKFRDTVRKFIKGDPGQVANLSECLMGSPDLFKKEGKRPYFSINYVSCHDGFTMWDLLSYDQKHNLENGEDNRDGENNNNSWNHGIEGETDDPSILALRKKQMKNLILLLMVSQGIPMISMGDEMARTQYGNNNPYCQDNDKYWMDWSRKEKFKDIFEFMKNMISFRKLHSVLRKACFLTNIDIDGNGIPDISWHGVKVGRPDWSDSSKSIAFMLDGESTQCECSEEDAIIYIAFNSHYEDLVFELPYIPEKKWHRVIDTADTENSFLAEPVPLDENLYRVEARSSILLICR